jgi:hypothetical protein
MEAFHPGLVTRYFTGDSHAVRPDLGELDLALDL